MDRRDSIRGPEQAHGVKTPEEYRRWAIAARRRGGVFGSLIERSERPVAYVNYGRWVCDCDCGNGPSVSPVWGLAICAECGSVYRPIVPPHWREIEALLLTRPRPGNRHWWPEETAIDLRLENAAHGLGVS